MNLPRNSRVQADSYRGVFPAMVLPLQRDGEIDFESLLRQVDFLLRGRVDGLWINGTSGDFFALDDDERAEVIKVVVRHVAGRVPVIAQVGDASTRRVISHARRALEARADAVSVTLPYYVDYSQDELKQHYRRVSDSIGRPVYLYQLPQMSKVSLTVPSIIELAEEEVLQGIKDSSGDMQFFYRLLREVDRSGVGLRCFTGVSSLVDVALYMGAHGLMCIVANLLPHLCKDAYLRSLEADWEGVKAVSSRIVALIDAFRLPGRNHWAPTVAVYKWVLCRLGVIATDIVFDPLKPLTPEEEALLARDALPLARELMGPLALGDDL
ncbi:MAG TPA: dihydrodipicolinate synthase family protein [Acidobacteriota bacterium]|nr:dihydrodipicolinate synthase family protein [Acidobacteriota bacterium]